MAIQQRTSSQSVVSEADPLVIAKQGHFFVGGQYYTTSAGKLMAGQMYVEYQVPKDQKHPFPIVMWHGGGQSGLCFTGTPDGRDGWAQFFLRRGYAVYVVDQPGRGRSAYSPDRYTPLVWRNSADVEDKFTASALTGPWAQAKLHTQWPGSGVAGDPVYDQFYAAQLPKLQDDAQRQLLNREAGKALLDRIGPAILLTHSESGDYGWTVGDARPDLVKGIVAVEPSGPPVYDWTFHKKGEMSRPWGVTFHPITYSPPVSDPKELSFVQQEKPDAPGLLACRLQKEPARQLVNLKKIPVLIVTSEASYHTLYDHGTAKYLTQAGVRVMHLKLAEHGIRGNGHMMMLEKNSLEIAELIAKWLGELHPLQ